MRSADSMRGDLARERPRCARPLDARRAGAGPRRMLHAAETIAARGLIGRTSPAFEPIFDENNAIEAPKNAISGLKKGPFWRLFGDFFDYTVNLNS